MRIPLFAVDRTSVTIVCLWVTRFVIYGSIIRLLLIIGIGTEVRTRLGLEAGKLVEIFKFNNPVFYKLHLYIHNCLFHASYNSQGHT